MIIQLSIYYTGNKDKHIMTLMAEFSNIKGFKRDQKSSSGLLGTCTPAKKIEDAN